MDTTILGRHESIVWTLPVGTDDKSVGYSLSELARPGLDEGDEMLLEIDTATEPIVSIGGNPIELEVVSGFGRLATVDLANATLFETFMEPGSTATITQRDILYRLVNCGEDNLVVREHCDQSNNDDMPDLELVVTALIAVCHI